MHSYKKVVNEQHIAVFVYKYIFTLFDKSKDELYAERLCGLHGYRQQAATEQEYLFYNPPPALTPPIEQLSLLSPAALRGIK